jgi:hypothetical protein
MWQGQRTASAPARLRARGLDATLGLDDQSCPYMQRLRVGKRGENCV